MKSFKTHLLNEAIKLSVFRKMYKEINNMMVSKYAKVWKAHKEDFPLNTSKRLFFPLKKDQSTLQSSSQKEIEKVLKDAGYVVEDYIDGVCYKVKADGTTDTKNKLKIGRVLNKLGNQELVKAYQTDINNMTKQHGTERTATSKEQLKAQSKDNMYIVISRHVYDYLGQTEGREWFRNSCKGITNGYTTNEKYLPEEFTNGWLIAFLVKEEDLERKSTNSYSGEYSFTKAHAGTIDPLKNPVARVLIIPFIKKGTESSPNPVGRLIVASEEVYGTNVPGFTDRVEEIINEIGLNKKATFGQYTVTKKGYTGTYEKEKTIAPPFETVLEQLHKIFGADNCSVSKQGTSITTQKDDWVYAFYKTFFGGRDRDRYLSWKTIFEDSASMKEAATGFAEGEDVQNYFSKHKLSLPEKSKLIEHIETFIDDNKTEIQYSIREYLSRVYSNNTISMKLTENNETTLVIHWLNSDYKKQEFIDSFFGNNPDLFFRESVYSIYRTVGLFDSDILTPTLHGKLDTYMKNNMSSSNINGFKIDETKLHPKGDVGIKIENAKERDEVLSALVSAGYDRAKGGSFRRNDFPYWIFPETGSKGLTYVDSNNEDFIVTNGYKIYSVPELVTVIKSDNFVAENNSTYVVKPKDLEAFLQYLDDNSTFRWAGGEAPANFRPRVIYPNRAILLVINGSISWEATAYDDEELKDYINRSDFYKNIKDNIVFISTNVNENKPANKLQKLLKEPNLLFIMGSQEEYDYFLEQAQAAGCIWEVRAHLTRLADRENMYDEAGVNYFSINTVDSDERPNTIGILGNYSSNSIEDLLSEAEADGYELGRNTYYVKDFMNEKADDGIFNHELAEKLKDPNIVYAVLTTPEEAAVLIMTAVHAGIPWAIYPDEPATRRSVGDIWSSESPYTLIEFSQHLIEPTKRMSIALTDSDIHDFNRHAMTYGVTNNNSIAISTYM